MTELGEYDITGYWNPIYGNTIEKHLNMQLGKRLQLENVKYAILTDDVDESITKKFVDAGFQKKTNLSGVYPEYDAIASKTVSIYENLNILGYAWAVDNMTTYDKTLTDERIINMINDKKFSIKDEALVSQNTMEDIGKLDQGSIRQNIVVTKYTYNTVDLKCDVDKKCLLLMSESNAPGWQVYVDGKKAKIYTADYDRRAVTLEAGAHMVEMRYCPTSFKIGCGISIFTILIVGWRGIQITKKKYRKKCEMSSIMRS